MASRRRSSSAGVTRHTPLRSTAGAYRSAAAATLAAMLQGPRRASALVDRRAVADAIPLFLPALPFGFVLGLAVTEGAMPPAVGWATSLFVFAGAAQLAVVTLAGTATLWSVVLAGLVINTRHVMYSAALAPSFQPQPPWFRWLGPFLLIDQVFALAVVADRSIAGRVPPLLPDGRASSSSSTGSGPRPSAWWSARSCPSRGDSGSRHRSCSSGWWSSA